MPISKSGGARHWISSSGGPVFGAGLDAILMFCLLVSKMRVSCLFPLSVGL
jgi:hypothetical protein